MALTPEGRVKEAVKRLLKAHGVWFFCPVSNGMGVHGIPDFICAMPPNGLFLGIEVKAAGKRKNTSALQDHQLAQIAGVGGIAVVVDDVSQLERLLQGLPDA